MHGNGSRTRDHSPTGRNNNNDEAWIPYANQPRSAAKGEDDHSGSYHHHHHHTLAGAHHHHHHSHAHGGHRDSSSSTGGAGSVGLKRRRASNRNDDYAVDDGPYGELGAPGGLQPLQTTSLGRERQASGRNASVGLPSPTVAHGQIPNKRSRTSSKKAQDSPDPGSPYYAPASAAAAAASSAGANGNSRSTGAGQNPRRKASTMADYSAVPGLEEDDGLPITGVDDFDEPLEGEEGDEVEQEDTRTYCYCDRVSFGDMIGCDGSECEREWFHLACLGMDTPPRGEWYCDECAAKMGKPQPTSAKKRRS